MTKLGCSLLAGVALVGLGCATSTHPGQVLNLNQGVSAPPPAATEEFKPRSYRIGFWEIDLFALDFEPRGTTFRMFDFKIFKLLEVGQGPDYQAFSFVEMPGLLNVVSSRHEEATGELRLFDVQALELALVRQTQDTETGGQTHFFKLPALGSLVSLQTDDSEPKLEHQNYLFMVHRDVERSPLKPPEVASPPPEVASPPADLPGLPQATAPNS